MNSSVSVPALYSLPQLFRERLLEDRPERLREQLGHADAPDRGDNLRIRCDVIGDADERPELTRLGAGRLLTACFACHERSRSQGTPPRLPGYIVIPATKPAKALIGS